MLEIHQDPDVNYHLLKLVKDEWPQVNDRTKIELVSKRYNYHFFTETRDLTTIEDSRIRTTIEELRSALRDNMSLVINDKNYLIKTIREYVEDLVVTEKTIPFELFCFNTGIRRGLLSCAYHAEDDTLYIQE